MRVAKLIVKGEDVGVFPNFFSSTPKNGGEGVEMQQARRTPGTLSPVPKEAAV